jgi:deazaflavin-dependent oxidoreductase (nitroreductase family)
VAHVSSDRHLPWWVPGFNFVAKPLLRLGVPMGPDVLITVRGRRTGLPRTTPVTICEYGGRRGVISPFGESNWARNLRSAGTATIRFGRRHEQVRAVELGHDDAVKFVREVIVPVARDSKLGDWFVRKVDKIDIDNPEEAVLGRPVFEIFPV